MNKPSLDELRIERKPEGGGSAGRWIVLAIFLLAGAGAAWFYWPGGTKATPVRTAVVREQSRQTAGTVLNASGYVTARLRATVSSKFTGQVTEVLIEEGMNVETGQVLARLDDSNIRTSFELARAQLLSAEKGVNETESLLREAENNLQRSERLVEQKLASVAELDRSRALAGSLEAQLNRKRADVEVAARQVDIYRQQLDDMIIRAPFSGVIVAKNAQPGEMISPVSAGGGFTRTGIGTIVDMSSLEIEIDVNEAYINRVEPEQKVVATLDAYPDWKIPCHVIAIIPTADRQRATVEVRVGFDQLDPRILPDMGVKVAFQEASQDEAAQTPAQPALAVPAAALRSEGGRDYVLIFDNGVVERRAVSVSANIQGNILLSSGVTAGERVIVDGPETLAEGARVVEAEK